MGNHECEAFVGKPTGKRLRTGEKKSPSLQIGNFFLKMI